MEKLLIFLEFVNSTNQIQSKFLAKLIFIIFLPIIYLIELLVYYHFWKVIIIREMLTNDNIVDFFDRNEFAYQGNKLYKEDLITGNDYYDSKPLDHVQKLLREEFVNSIYQIIKENTQLNLEDNLNLIVECDIKSIKNQTEVLRAKVYSVTIRFYRYHILSSYKSKLFLWVLVTGIISILVSETLPFIIKFITQLI